MEFFNGLLAAFLESREVEDQRKALFAFCERIVADAASREIVIEANRTGIAHDEALPGLPAGLCDSNLPGYDSNPDVDRDIRSTT